MPRYWDGFYPAGGRDLWRPSQKHRFHRLRHRTSHFRSFLCNRPCHYFKTPVRQTRHCSVERQCRSLAAPASHPSPLSEWGGVGGSSRTFTSDNHNITVISFYFYFIYLILFLYFLHILLLNESLSHKKKKKKLFAFMCVNKCKLTRIQVHAHIYTYAHSIFFFSNVTFFMMKKPTTKIYTKIPKKYTEQNKHTKQNKTN